MTKELLVKFLNDQCSEKELAEIIEWIKTESLSKQSHNLAREDWKLYSSIEQNNISPERAHLLLDKIHHQINLRNARKNPIKFYQRYIAWGTRAAAILLFPVLMFLFYTLSNQSAKLASVNQAVDSLEVIAPIGSRTIVQLIDGSEVHLNYGSSIKYPQHFVGETREVVLTGEGYFNVAHNPQKPFIVKTGKLNIKAVGTVFNVEAYPEDVNIKTTLVEGKIFIEKKLKDGNTQTIGSMVPGQHISYNILNDEIECIIGNIEKYVAWKDGKLIFENDPITFVATQLSRKFNVDIEIEDELIKELTYTVTFIDEPLFQILDLMTIATPVTYKAFPRERMPDGSFSKQKILFKKRQNKTLTK